ncbi:MAG: LacI family DNA-binding transcriptional regulator [Lachnospiraceae bacterium]|nr:LacI family DNA-binding transcriptional regulator [Lachnospiraceae bacterium]
MVSMKDISKACGVSVATVSKALNDHSDIGEETKQHIRQVARQMGYSPNLSARALKTNKTHGIGVLFVDDARSGLTHDYFASVLDSFKRMAEKCGYDITFINSSKNRKGRMTYLEHSRYRGFDGVAIACIDFDDPEVAELVQSNIPVVTIDYIYDNHIAILSDNAGGMHELMGFVCGQGHERVAYIHGAASNVTTKRLASFYRTAEEFGVEIPDEYVREAPYRNTEKSYRETKELLQLKEPPTCILYPDDYAAVGGMNAIRDMGLRIPEDISVAGYDGIPLGKHLQPQLTTVQQDTEQIGVAAARELISLIERPKSTLVEQITIPGHLVEGSSVSHLKQKERDQKRA